MPLQRVTKCNPNEFPIYEAEFTPEAEKQLAKIDRQSAKRITNFLRERIAAAENPRSLGKALKEVLRDFGAIASGTIE